MSVGEQIAGFLWGVLLPSLKNVSQQRDRKAATADVILQIRTFYASVRGFVHKNTREKVDSAVDDLLSSRKTAGMPNLYEWVERVFTPLMEDHRLTDLLSNYTSTIVKRPLRG